MPILPAPEDSNEKFYSATELLENFCKDAEKLRMAGVFEGLEDKGSDPFATEHYLLALNALEMAQRHFKLALYHQRRALTGK